MKLARLLMGCILTDESSAFEEATSNVYEVHLPVRILGSHCQGQEHKERGKEKYFYPDGQIDFIPSQDYGKFAGTVVRGL